MTAAAAMLEVADLHKSFGETRALDGCSFSVRRGEVHALVGENGSGKSTLVKILSGVLRQDSGAVALEASGFECRSPDQAQRRGVSAVFQETLVVEQISILDNVALGADGLFRSDARGWAAAVPAALEEVGLAGVDPATPVSQLSLGQRQLVAVARALIRPWRLLILDEAGSALDIQDRDRLLALAVRYRDEGRSVLLISHRMDEIARVADRVTVLRSGRTIETLERAEASTERVLRLAGGPGEGGGEASAAPARRSAPAAVLMRARGLTLSPGAKPIDLDVRGAEILGVLGLEGHGQELFVEAVAGIRAAESGTVEIETDSGPRPVNGHQGAARLGIAYVPRDRKNEGIFPGRSVRENVTISVLSRLARLGWLRRGAIDLLVESFIERLRIRTAGPGVPIGSLSGGNQQKVVLARALSLEPRVLVLNDPLRGVDRNAATSIHALLSELVAGGMAVVMLSTEIEELLSLCDRIAVFHEGGLATELSGRINRDETIAAMFGQTESGAAA